MSALFNATALVVPFENLRMTDVESVGGKNASLGEMISQLPEGVRVLRAAARRFGLSLTFDEFDFASCDYFAKHGEMMPADWKARIGGHDAISMSYSEVLDLPQQLSAAGTVRLPGSKSISNRVLLLAALADGETEVRDLLASDDTERMLEALKALGVGVGQSGGENWRITGCGGRFPVPRAELFLGNEIGRASCRERV